AVPAPYYFRRPASGYPDTPPIITIDAPDVPSYVRLSAIKRAVTYAQDNLCGDSMIFNLLEWLESSMPDIIQNPGRLSDLEISSQTMSKEAPCSATKVQTL